jgi:hypothetical protein
MRDRHWDELREEIHKQFDPNADDFTLEKVTNATPTLHLHILFQL